MKLTTKFLYFFKKKKKNINMHKVLMLFTLSFQDEFHLAFLLVHLLHWKEQYKAFIWNSQRYTLTDKSPKILILSPKLMTPRARVQ